MARHVVKAVQASYGAWILVFNDGTREALDELEVVPRKCMHCGLSPANVCFYCGECDKDCCQCWYCEGCRTWHRFAPTVSDSEEIWQCDKCIRCEKTCTCKRCSCRTAEKKAQAKQL